jgi:hypothetical protein
VPAAQPPDQLAGGDVLPGGDEDAQRLVLGADAVRVRDHHEAPAGHLTREAHRPRTGRQDRGAGRARQVDAAVSGRVPGRWWLESAHDHQAPGERWCVRRSDRARPGDPEGGAGRCRGGGACTAAAQQHHTGHEWEGAHPSRVDRIRGESLGSGRGCGQRVAPSTEVLAGARA